MLEQPEQRWSVTKAGVDAAVNVADAAPVIVLGSGHAGYSVARELGRRKASLLLLTADDGQFYSKPALSEALRLGIATENLASRTAQQMAGQIRGAVQTGVRITKVLPQERLVCSGEQGYRYSALVLALGADPVRLPLQIDAESCVYSVNSLEDYRRFRIAIAGKRRVAVIGAGLVGCEFANDLVDAGHQVAVVDPAPQPLGRMIPPQGGDFLRAALAQRGVEWFLGAGVTCIQAQGEGVSLLLDDGKGLQADVVLSSVGVKPRVSLAAAAGLPVRRGIVVDRCMRTADPNIYALGDCAEVEGRLLPYIAPIGLGAKVVAANVLGGEESVRYPAMPVSVKTPACPTVICSPPEGAAGRWFAEDSADSTRLLFRTADGGLGGFVLQGKAVEEADALAQQIPAWLE